MVSSMAARKLTFDRKRNQKEHGFYHVLFFGSDLSKPIFIMWKKN